MIQKISELLAAAFSPRINRVVILQAPIGGRTSCGVELLQVAPHFTLVALGRPAQP
jgi:hypothetical protein